MPALRSLMMLAALLLTGEAPAQDYPNRPITLIVPFAPGGLGDLVARRLQESVSTALGETVLVDFKSGGGGAVGAVHVKNAAPDGYTLMIANASIMAINPSLMTITYDPQREFSPIAMLVSTSHILLVPAASPVKTVADLVTAGTSGGKPLSFASAGVGGGGHLLGEMFKQATGVAAFHVPYRGAAPAMQDVLGGRIDFYFESVALAAPHVQSGGVRALAVTSAKRLPGYPDVPTMGELGHPTVNADSWFALFGPKGLPRPIVERLNAVFTQALADPGVIKILSAQGLDLLPGTPEGLAQTVKVDLERYATLIHAIGATAQ